MHLKCRSKMSACILRFLGLLIFVGAIQNGQAEDGPVCSTLFYENNGSCHRCKAHCRACVSDTNCTLCKQGFYGPVCEKPCGRGCKGTCHKIHGHCTYGCPDGEYPAENNRCLPCLVHCTLCDSRSSCVLCEDGYFGEACNKTCPAYCIRCEKKSGKCSQCKNTYFIHDELCKSCPHGCRLCSTTSKCQSCEDGFHGPVDGRCLFKCPGNETYVVPDLNGRCGIWQDTDGNICDGHADKYMCLSRGNCLQERPCSASVMCGSDSTRQEACPVVMTYTCKHICKKLFTRNGCETVCNVMADTNGYRSTTCMTADVVSVDIQKFKSNAEASCEPDYDQKSDTAATTAATVFACLLPITIVIFIIYWIRHVLRLPKKDTALPEGGVGATLSPNLEVMAGAEEPLFHADSTDNRHSSCMNYNYSRDGDLHETMNENNMKVHNGTTHLRRRTRKSRKSRNGVKGKTI